MKKAFLAAAVSLVLIWPVDALDLAGLQAQVDSAVPGQILTIPAGDYNGQLVVRHSVVLRGSAGTRLIHQPGRAGPTLWIQAPDVRIEGLEIVGSGEGTRRDHTAVVISAAGVRLSEVTIRQAWAGIWIDRADGALVQKVSFRGLADFPFWQRGEGVRVTASNHVRMSSLDLKATEDGVYMEQSSDVRLEGVRVQEARYAVHSMFSSDSTASGVHSNLTVAGLMLMESSGWTIQASSFSEGYLTGSAGVREIRTKNIVIRDCSITRQAAGIELLDARDGLFEGNLVEESGVAWTWGGDNSGTVVRENTHRGNLVDVAGTEPRERDLIGADAHHHGPAAARQPTVAPSLVHLRPNFDHNYWDAWHGLDIDGDGIGDTPFRFDPSAASMAVSRPWLGIFLGSPWSALSQTIQGGEVLDANPLFRAGRLPFRN